MQEMQLYIPGNYDTPFSASGRARTIAAFHVLQQNTDTLSKDVRMRRVILSKLMSQRSVGYWLRGMGWLEKKEKVGKVQLLTLTAKGIAVCRNSAGGGSAQPTTKALIEQWCQRFTQGHPNFTKTTFDAIG